jgi:hypothetical protein
MFDRATNVVGRLVRNRTLVVIITLVAMMPLVFCGGCYGPFPLTKTVYEWNGSLDTDLGQTLVFWAFVIIPVYSVAMLADALVFNLVEFWTGDQLMAANEVTLDDGTMMAVVPSDDGTEAVVTFTRDDQVLGRVKLVKVSDELLEIRSEDGKLLGSAQMDQDGIVDLADATGNVLSKVRADELSKL